MVEDLLPDPEGRRRSARNDNRYLPFVPRRSRAVDQALEQLERSPALIADLTKDLTGAQLHAIPGPDEWSANDVLAHLRACADVWGRCIATIIDNDVPTIRAISPRGWIKRTNYRDLTFRASLERLAGHEHHHLEQFARIAAAVRESSE